MIAESTNDPKDRSEAIKQLRDIQGDLSKITAWNTFREQNPSWKVDLSEVDLPGVNLTAAVADDDRKGVDLSNFNLFGADLRGADLRNVSFEGAILSHAKLNQADLKYAVLREANLRDAHLGEVSLYKADITGADLRGVDLSKSHLFRVVYDRSGLNKRCKGIRGMDSCYGDAIFRRDALDQDFIDSVRSRLFDEKWKPLPTTSQWQLFLFRFWEFIDYGRSLTRVAMLASVLSFFFGLIYFFDREFGPVLLDYCGSANTRLSPFYFSIVAYTTLGFGDITPDHWVGELIVMTEVVLGYLTFGLVLAILTQIVARRA